MYNYTGYTDYNYTDYTDYNRSILKNEKSNTGDIVVFVFVCFFMLLLLLCTCITFIKKIMIHYNIFCNQKRIETDEFLPCYNDLSPQYSER